MKPSNYFPLLVLCFLVFTSAAGNTALLLIPKNNFSFHFVFLLKSLYLIDLWTFLMSFNYFFFLCLFLRKIGTVLGNDHPCGKPLIHIINCSKLACVQSCVQKYNESINGACIDMDNCCCNVLILG